MDDKDLHNIFAHFDPVMPSESEFTTRLQLRLDVVDMVKQQTATLQRSNRLAVFIAALSGLVTGIILTLLFPHISQWMMSILSGFCTGELADICCNCAVCSIMALLSVAIAVNGDKLTFVYFRHTKMPTP